MRHVARFASALGLMASISIPVADAQARPTTQSSAITYQGQLKQAGSPVNGNVDLQFRLFDAAAAGTQIGLTLVSAPVVVSNGTFTVSLDFGALAYNGEERWLEIGVASPAGGGVGPFTTLTPRQQLASAPYAAFALNALLPATYAGTVNFTSPSNAFRGNGVNLTGLNASNVGTGTLADARLSSNVGTLAATQTFTGAKTFAVSPSFTAAGAPFTVTSNTLVTNLNADLLDGLSSAAFLQAVPNPLTLTGSAIGSHIIRGQNTAATGTSFGVRGDSASTSGVGVLGIASAATGNALGGKFETSSTTGVAAVGTAYATSGINTGMWGETLSTSGRGVFGQALAATGVTSAGRFENFSINGVGVWAVTHATSSANYTIFAENNSPAGIAVLGRAESATGGNNGVTGVSASTTGIGVSGIAEAATGVNYGGRFESISPTGRGVLGYAYATTGDNYGVQGQTNSNSGMGVFGTATANTGLCYGVYGESDSDTGYGVFGFSVDSIAVGGTTTGTSGVNYAGRFISTSTSGTGVYGRATAAVGVAYGVYGQAATTATGFAVYANGDMGASGVKPFRIDHPDDPANKYLMHYAAESPEVINFYSGKVTLNGMGEAVVELPLYFAKINKDPRYTLTAVGAAMPNLHVADEIDEGALIAGAKAEPGQPSELCWFRIAGGAPGMKVSWEVKAVRNDRYVQRRGAPVEVDKQDFERGTYQQPELYGQPEQMGAGYREEPAPRTRDDLLDEPARTLNSQGPARIDQSPR
jgi:hypothetical protein